MTENSKIELLGKLIGKDQIKKVISTKQKTEDFLTIKPNQLNDYLVEGWEKDKEFKTTIKIKKNKPIDIAFEDEVWSLFGLMGYDFLNKDRNFKIPYDKIDGNLTKQIDVFAKDDETILIVECKTAEKNKRGDFKKELESYQGIFDGIRKSIQSLFPSTKHKIKFILATKNLSISDEDKERLNSNFKYNKKSYCIAQYNNVYDDITHLVCKTSIMINDRSRSVNFNIFKYSHDEFYIASKII
jgi:DNA sulfur modification protein DndB